MSAIKNYNILLIGVLTVLCLIGALWSLFTSTVIVFDDLEHLRAAFLVSQGYVPYRDFFEHHNPLLWYVLWPIVRFMPHDTLLTLYAGRAFCFAASIFTGFFIWNIEAKFIAGKKAAWIALLLYLLAIPSWPALFHVKPDTFMHLCFFAGLFYFFKYLHFHKLNCLFFSALCFTIGFWFLQTIIFLCLPLCFVALWFLYKYPSRIVDFAKAAVIPLFISAIFIALLFASDAWGDYWNLNFIFNALLFKNLHNGLADNHIVLLMTIDLLLLAGLTVLLQMHKKRIGNIFYNSLIFLFCSELAQRFIFYSALPHYYIMLCIYASMLAAPMVCFLLKKNKLWQFAFLGLFALHLCAAVFCNYYRIKTKMPITLLKNFDRYSPSFGMVNGIYQPLLHYYWLLPNIELLHNIIYQRNPDYNANDLIKNNQVQLIVLIDTDNPNATLKDGDIRTRDFIRKHQIDKSTLMDFDEIYHHIYKRKNTDEGRHEKQ